MDSRKIIYLILLAMATGLVVVHLQTIHTQSVNRMISMRAEEQELAKEIAQQQVELNSGMYSPEKLLEKIKSLNLEVKPLLEVELEAKKLKEQNSGDNSDADQEQAEPEQAAPPTEEPEFDQWGDTEYIPEQQYDESLEEEYRPEPSEYDPIVDTEDNTGATSEPTEYSDDQDIYPDVPEEEKNPESEGPETGFDPELEELDSMGQG